MWKGNVMVKAIKVSNDKDPRESYYRCSGCYAMFKPMIFFTEWDFFDCIPRVCPNCAAPLENGMKEL